MKLDELRSKRINKAKKMGAQASHIIYRLLQFVHFNFSADSAQFI